MEIGLDYPRPAVPVFPPRRHRHAPVQTPLPGAEQRRGRSPAGGIRLMHSRRRLHAAVPRIVLGIAAFFSILLLLDAAWIPAKAQLAQFLIARN